MSDLWGKPKQTILRAAEARVGVRAVHVQPLTSGLWAYVTMTDGSEVTVYDTDVSRFEAQSRIEQVQS